MDDSLKAKVAGCGFTIGRKVGISILDNEISIDFGKFGWRRQSAPEPQRNVQPPTAASLSSSTPF